MSNYVQMRTCLRDHGQVLKLARATRQTVPTVIGCLYILWCLDVEHGHTEGNDVRVEGYGREDVDARTFQGFASAVEDLGWATFDDFGCTLHNARKYQKDVREVREKYRLKKRRQREREDALSPEMSPGTSPEKSPEMSPRCPGTDKIRLDKTREEIQNPPTPLAAKAAKRQEPGEDVQIPASLDTPDFRAAWSAWLEFRRKDLRKPLTARSARQQFTEFESCGVQAAITAIRRSIASGYTGVFPDANQSGRLAAGRAGAIAATRIATEYAEAPTPLPIFNLAPEPSNANGGEGGLNGVHAPPR